MEESNPQAKRQRPKVCIQLRKPMALHRSKGEISAGIRERNRHFSMARRFLSIVLISLACAASAQDGVSQAVAKLRIIGLTADSFVWVDGALVPTPESDTLSLPLGVHRVSVWEEGFLPVENDVVTVREDDSAVIVFQRLKSHLVRAKGLRDQAFGIGIAGGLITVGGIALTYFMNQAWLDEDDLNSPEADAIIAGCRTGLVVTAVGIGVDIWATATGFRSGAEKSKHLDFKHFAIFAVLSGK
jgi:hypothetical protein